MIRLNGKAWRLLLAALALALIATACGGDDDANGGTGDVQEDLSGSIVVSGSSTVEPISVGVAEKFSSVNPDVEIRVDGPGTGDGFELFCNGETDISDASRAIDPEEEIPACEENGIEFIELKVAIDGLSVITSPANEAAECLSFPDLYALLGPESEGFNNWSDANDLGAEVGGSGDYPDAPLVITAPGEESGTYDSFIEIVLEGIAEERSQDATSRPDYQASADDNVIVEGIANNDTSLGWVGFAFAVQNPDTIRAVPIEGEEGGGCVEPDPETISSGEYPIARDLFIYVNKAKLDENPAVQAYVDYYLTDEGIASATEVGYVALDPADLEATRSVWESGETGTREG